MSEALPQIGPGLSSRQIAEASLDQGWTDIKRAAGAMAAFGGLPQREAARVFWDHVHQDECEPGDRIMTPGELEAAARLVASLQTATHT